MKKSLIIIITVMLVVFVMAGCTQSEAVTPKATPTPTPTIQPSATPEATPTPTPEPVSAILQEVTETTEYEIPEAYDVLTFEEDVVGVDTIAYTIYSFEDKHGKTHYRAYGFRTDPASSENYDEGIYALEVAESEIDGKKSVATVFDIINAMPVDLTQEKDLYIEKKESKPKATKNAEAKKTSKPKATSKSSEKVEEAAPQQEVDAPVQPKQEEVVPPAAPAQPAPTSAPPAPEPTHWMPEIDPNVPIFHDGEKSFDEIMVPPPPPPDSW